MIKRRWNSYHSKYAIKTIDILKFNIERMAKVQSYPVLEGWRQGQCRYFQFCMCHRGDLYVDQFRIANWYLLTNFVFFFEKHNETILGRECNETVFQPCDINWSPQKTTKSWRDVGIWKKKARVNRHHNLCNPFPWMGNPFSLITHSFLRLVHKTRFIRTAIRN